MKLKQVILIIGVLLAFVQFATAQDTAATIDSTWQLQDSSVLHQDTFIGDPPIDTAGFTIPGTSVTIDTSFVDSVCLSVRDVIKLLNTKPGEGGDQNSMIWWLIAAAGLVIDLVLRFIPTARNSTIINLIDNILDGLVKLVNGTGNKAKTESGDKAAFKSNPTPVN